MNERDIGHIAGGPGELGQVDWPAQSDSASMSMDIESNTGSTVSCNPKTALDTGGLNGRNGSCGLDSGGQVERDGDVKMQQEEEFDLNVKFTESELAVIEVRKWMTEPLMTLAELEKELEGWYE